MNKLAKILMAAALTLGASATFQPSKVNAQASASVGSVRGVIKDKGDNNQPAVGATIVATSPALVGQQVVIAEGDGQYFLTSLPPGVYTLTIYYNGQPFSRGNVLVQLGKEAVVNVTVDSTAGTGKSGEVITIIGKPAIIDQGSTKTGATITEDYTRNIPVGRTFAAVLGATAGSQEDFYGTSLAGATSVENVYVVEGINTTDTGFGGLSSNLPNEFISETEIIAGGYNAEFGRATGGIINVVTKQGSDEYKGSVFGYFRPGGLVADAETINREGSSIDHAINLDYQYDFGAEVGGPIIPKRLWFHVGFNPQVRKTTISRFVQGQTDENDDGVPDFDPETGLTTTKRLSTTDITQESQRYFYTAKINGALNQNHQFQVSAFGNPGVSEPQFLELTRAANTATRDREDGAYDVAAKWTSKFNDGKTQVDAVVGFHRGFKNDTPKNAEQNVETITFSGLPSSLYDFTAVEGVGAAACQDGNADDDYKKITNCPVVDYVAQGMGVLEERTNDRTSAVLAVTQRVKTRRSGYHTFKAGVDAELATYNAHKVRTGSASILRRAAVANGQTRWRVSQYNKILRNLRDDEKEMLANGGELPLEENQLLCSGTNALCEVTEALDADTNNTNLAAFLQDSWQILPNLTLNAGIRWEQQTGHVAKALQGTIAPTGELIPEDAYQLQNLLSPRLGFIYDPTSEGKSKLFGHWGRFYENVPMDINVRAFGGEITHRSNYNNSTRTSEQAGYDPNCDVNAGTPELAKTLLQCKDVGGQNFIGEGVEYVSPGLQGQYTQELILGAEYEFAADFTLGLVYTHRTLPVIIEDISTDGGNSYMITNPGVDMSDEADKLRAEAMGLKNSGNAKDMELAALYEERANLLDFVGSFDKPTRNYDSVALTAKQRPTKRSLVQASYTYSVTKGNYPGLFSTETQQLDPNLTSLYDLPDLMANRYGPLGHDRPHNLKVDAFYQFDLKKGKLGVLTTGASFRASSGIAHNALGGHPIYGAEEAYLLPRGAIARSPVTSQADIHVSYGYRVNKNTMFEGFVRVFNLFNAQSELDVDEEYTSDNAIPVVGGTREDLDHVKVIDGRDSSQIVRKNLNFGRLSERQLPRFIELGFRVTF